MTKIQNLSIFAQLSLYQEEFDAHPFFEAAKKNNIPDFLLREFALYQCVDSILWVPMLSLMKSKVIKSSRFRQAIEDNICCETGIGNVSHITLAKDFNRSVGVELLRSEPLSFLVKSVDFWLSDEFDSFTEPMVVGWLLVAETLVPQMFAKMMSSFEAVGADSLYLREHVVVDVDEHSQWMSESVNDVLALYGPECIAEILAGMREAWEETVEIPNVLFAKIPS
jgi:pyrroloquinoline quinone (PQQ) biosynthesis protein C